MLIFPQYHFSECSELSGALVKQAIDGLGPKAPPAVVSHLQESLSILQKLMPEARDERSVQPVLPGQFSEGELPMQSCSREAPAVMLLLTKQKRINLVYPGTALVNDAYAALLAKVRTSPDVPVAEIRDAICEIVREHRKWEAVRNFIRKLIDEGNKTGCGGVVNGSHYSVLQLQRAGGCAKTVHTRRKASFVKMVNELLSVVGPDTVKQLVKVKKWLANGGLKEKVFWFSSVLRFIFDF
jgi:hypothetical protein